MSRSVRAFSRAEFSEALMGARQRLPVVFLVLGVPAAVGARGTVPICFAEHLSVGLAIHRPVAGPLERRHPGAEFVGAQAERLATSGPLLVELMDDALRVAVGERHDDAIVQPGQCRRVLAHQGVGEAGRVVEPDVFGALAAQLGEDRVGLVASAGSKEHLGHVRPWVGQPTSAGRDGRLPRLEGLVVTLQPAQRLGQSAEELGIARSSYYPLMAGQAAFADQRFILPFPKPLAPRGYVMVEIPAVVPEVTLDYLIFDFGKRGARVDAAAA